MTARIKDELVEQLDEVAAGYDRSRAWVIARALERYLEEELDLLGSIAEAEADVAAGRVYTHEQIKEMFGLPQDQRDAA